MKNISLHNWKTAKPSPGIWINLPELHTAEMLARLQVDWICIDLQHGLMTRADLYSLIPAISGTDTTPLVRVVANSAGEIGKVLDAGAHGVIVPMINTQQEAERAAAACRYPPLGERSCGPMRGAMLEGFEYLTTANDEIACIAMIETREGLENVEAIAATPGIDALFVGPMDLCYGLGIAPGDFGNTLFLEAIQSIKNAAKKAQCALGLYGYTPEIAGDALKDGFDFVSIGTDIGFCRAGAASALEAAIGKPETQETKSAGY